MKLCCQCEHKEKILEYENKLETINQLFDNNQDIEYRETLLKELLFLRKEYIEFKYSILCVYDRRKKHYLL